MGPKPPRVYTFYFQPLGVKWLCFLIKLLDFSLRASRFGALYGLLSSTRAPSVFLRGPCIFFSRAFINRSSALLALLLRCGAHELSDVDVSARRRHRKRPEPQAARRRRRRRGRVRKKPFPSFQTFSRAQDEWHRRLLRRL